MPRTPRSARSRPIAWKPGTTAIICDATINSEVHSCRRNGDDPRQPQLDEVVERERDEHDDVDDVDQQCVAPGQIAAAQLQQQERQRADGQHEQRAIGECPPSRQALSHVRRLLVRQRAWRRVGPICGRRDDLRLSRRPWSSERRSVHRGPRNRWRQLLRGPSKARLVAELR